jgi:cytochrome c2
LRPWYDTGINGGIAGTSAVDSRRRLPLRSSSYLLALVACAVIVVAVAWAAGSDAMPDRGNVLSTDSGRFNTLIPSEHEALEQCVVCHRISADGPERSAPSLWGIVGARKARAHWFGYSLALSQQTGNWTADAIDAYLADPEAYLPGTSKTLSRVRDPEQRKQIITALQSLSAH